MHFEWMIYCAVGALAWFAGRWLHRRGEAKLRKCDEWQGWLDKFKQDIEASQQCCASIVHFLGAEAKCQCFACRRNRGESVTEESQKLAESGQKEAAMALKAQVDGWQ